jgi:hypothetical protein
MQSAKSHRAMKKHFAPFIFHFSLCILLSSCAALQNLRAKAALAPYSEPPRIWIKYQWRY